jgi:ABC-type Fe3+ transport system substrate-binding protein
VTVRVYLPVTSSGLAGLVAEGRLAGPFRAHAVTDALRVEWADGDDEAWEYAALMAAAATSAGLQGSGDAPRRYVIAADVPSVVPVPGDDPTLVDVAAAHVDTEDHPDDDDDLAWFATQEIAHLLA